MKVLIDWKLCVNKSAESYVFGSISFVPLKAYLKILFYWKFIWKF